MSVPLRRMAPRVTSWKRKISEAMVDLPVPVPPMMAVVWPRRQVKSSSLRVSSSASAKRKETLRKDSTSGASSSKGWGGPLTRSWISGVWSSTTCTRSQHSSARGIIIMTIWAIIKKNSTMVA